MLLRCGLAWRERERERKRQAERETETERDRERDECGWCVFNIMGWWGVLGGGDKILHCLLP